MGRAKDILVAPIDRRAGMAFIRRHHYSGKALNNSWLYLGVWLSDVLIGSLSFGAPIDIRKSKGLVQGTAWDGFCELGRLCMVDDTPPNVESRALSVAFRLIRREYPYIEWVQTFADGTQCGDGTIYRACGCLLTQIKRNTEILRNSDGMRVSQLSFSDRRRVQTSKGPQNGSSGVKWLLDSGYEFIPGYQLRYLKLLYPGMESRLTCPVLPYSAIAEAGAGMYLGRPKDSSEPPVHHTGEGGAAPTRTLHTSL